MFNGRRRFAQSSARSYRGGAYRPRAGMAAMRKGSYKRRSYVNGRVALPKFALSGYRKDTEKKYRDKVIVSSGFTGVIPGATNTSGGAGATSTTWALTQPFGTAPTPLPADAQDLLRGVDQGTTASTRIGNKITAKYVKGNITIQANQVTNQTTGFENAQYGESRTTSTAGQLDQYLRTTYRVVIVKDLQVNSTSTTCNWTDVFEDTNNTGGVHSELKIANMGRYSILKDNIYNLDADDPQKTIPFLIKNVGQVRYNGPTGAALVNQSIYVIWACWSHGINRTLVNNSGINGGSVLVSSRLCFTDS